MNKKKGDGKAPRKGGFPKAMPPRVKFVVMRAGLVGVNWSDRKISGSIYEMQEPFLTDLSYWLNRRIAHIVGPAAPNGKGWTDLVCLPGRGMFVATLTLEEAK